MKNTTKLLALAVWLIAANSSRAETQTAPGTPAPAAAGRKLGQQPRIHGAGNQPEMSLWLTSSSP